AANIAFTDNAGNNTIALTGTGTSPEFSASPASKDYGSANTGTTATAQTFTITNTGDAPLTISAVTLAGANPGQFTLADGAADTCTGQSIIPSATCEVKATFSPTSTGAKTASITFTDNAGNNTIDLAGTSTEPGFSADPESKDFGSQSIATTTTEVFTITNDRDGPLTISAVGLTGANPNQFALTGGGADTCTGQTIAAAQTCEVEASFSPTSTGTKTANISFTDNAGDNSITLSGTGTAGVFSASPSSKEFGAQEVGTTTAQMFTVTNTGDGPLIVSAVDLTGMNPGQFSVATGTSDTCSGQTLAPFDTCTVEASFSPTSSGDKSANLAFTDSDGGHDVALSGTGESTNNLPPELVLECPTGSCAGVDLRGINLAGVDASGVDFKGANLAGANLTQTQLVAADFRGADLVRVNATSADFRSARMQRARFSKPLPVGRGDMVTKQFAAAKLTGANFRNANLTKAIMEGVDIRRANLRNVRADRVKLSFAKVQRANFSGAGLRYGNFSNANCARASFARADLFKARFTSANLKGATFRGAKGLKTTFR
ncbi:MAG: choice-of-anchor D domain-containing protein, partial [Candidatus Nanopelagicales bacterium]